jgi:hypothetical protein
MSEREREREYTTTFINIIFKPLVVCENFCGAWKTKFSLALAKVIFPTGAGHLNLFLNFYLNSFNNF